MNVYCPYSNGTSVVLLGGSRRGLGDAHFRTDSCS